MSILKAGSASIVVQLGDDCFPNAESVMKHDDVYVRVLIFDAGRRYAILEADMPSMFPSQIKYCKKLLNDVAGVAPEDSWIVVSHGFSAPHTWPLEAGEQKDTMRPKVLDENPEYLEIAKKINQAYYDAYGEAVAGALATLREARVGFGTGTCGLNVYRNIPTADGWWEGVNWDGYVDKTLSIMRFDDLEGNPIAILYGYSMKVDIMAGMFPDVHGKVTSSDIVGVASKYVEDEYGNGCTAIFLCGATGDQACPLRGNYIETDKDGKVRKGSLGLEASFGVLAAMGELFGNTIVQTAQKVQCTDSDVEVKTSQVTYTCSCQKRDADMGKLNPSKVFRSVPDGTRDLTIDAMVVGDIALVGVLPELDGITVAEIREQSPFARTIVSCFVNGNSKSMPCEKAYDLITKGSQNSPFVRGSAEQTRDEAVKLLQKVKEM